MANICAMRTFPMAGVCISGSDGLLGVWYPPRTGDRPPTPRTPYEGSWPLSDFCSEVAAACGALEARCFRRCRPAAGQCDAVSSSGGRGVVCREGFGSFPLCTTFCKPHMTAARTTRRAQACTFTDCG
eukprot:gene24793-biopygen22425